MQAFKEGYEMQKMILNNQNVDDMQIECVNDAIIRPNTPFQDRIETQELILQSMAGI